MTSPKPKKKEGKGRKPRAPTAAQITTRAANTKPHQWKPGQSGNPGGRPAIIQEVKDIARGYTVQAMETLAGIMSNAEAPPSARVAAAAHILDRGYGKPTQNINAQVRNAQKMTDDELIAFLTSADEAGGSEGDAAPTLN